MRISKVDEAFGVEDNGEETKDEAAMKAAYENGLMDDELSMYMSLAASLIPTQLLARLLAKVSGNTMTMALRSGAVVPNWDDEKSMVLLREWVDVDKHEELLTRPE